MRDEFEEYPSNHFADCYTDGIASLASKRSHATPMNPTRQTKIDDLEAVMQLKIRQSDLPIEALVQEKLAHLRAFIRQLALTPNGKIDLARRVQLFGECLPSPGESDRQYYGKLRHWLDRDLESQRVT